jgi:hypothetical protein
MANAGLSLRRSTTAAGRARALENIHGLGAWSGVILSLPRHFSRPAWPLSHRLPAPAARSNWTLTIANDIERVCLLTDGRSWLLAAAQVWILELGGAVLVPLVYRCVQERSRRTHAAAGHEYPTHNLQPCLGAPFVWSSIRAQRLRLAHAKRLHLKQGATILH